MSESVDSKLVERAWQEYRLAFGGKPDVMWAAPGRINVLGEHTDYNDGLVMPHAIGYYTVVAASRSSSPTWRVYSDAAGEIVTFGPSRVAESLPRSEAVDGWAAYVAGVVWSLRVHVGRTLPGARITVVSDVPVGAGLSSSAALEMAVLNALCELYGIDPTPSERVHIAQRAENEYVGAPTGILDQSASLLSRPSEVLYIDCRTERTQHVPFDVPGHEVMVIDSCAPHRHVDGEYASRRADCARAAAALEVGSLREVSPNGYIDLPDLVLRRRVRHVVTENARTRAAARLLQTAPDSMPQRLGRLMTDSHLSMMADYEITVPEVDHAVSAALRGGAVGARMTGGGFGGSIIALVPRDHVETVREEIVMTARDNDFPEPDFYSGAAVAGAHRVRRLARRARVSRRRFRHVHAVRKWITTRERHGHDKATHARYRPGNTQDSGDIVARHLAVFTPSCFVHAAASVTAPFSGGIPLAHNIVILAAGVGSRLGKPHPKSLTPLSDGETILHRALRLLTPRFSRHTIHLVVGFKKEMIMEAAPDVGYMYNQDYGDTNTSKSLLKALNVAGPGGVMWLNGDVVFDEKVIDDLLPHIAMDRSFVCVNTSSVAEEEVKYTVDGEGYIKELSKTVSDGALGEAVGINFISSADRPVLTRRLEECDAQDYFERGLELGIDKDGLKVEAIDISQHPVIEVDFAEDLARAKDTF